jgi:probable blue pigment (indigoidine) exporter
MEPSVHPVRDERVGILAAAGAAILFGAAYPATAIALRSFSPIGIAAIACVLALPVVLALAATGLVPRPRIRELSGPAFLRLTVLAALGGLLFIAAANVAVALSGPTVTGFVAPLYAVAAAVFAVPILGEPLRARTVGAFGVALVGTALIAGVGSGTASIVSPGGIALAVVAAVSFGLYIVLARRWSGPYDLDGTLVTIASLTARGPFLLVIELIIGDGPLVPVAPDPAAVLALLSIAFGASSTANLLLLASVRRVTAARTSAALLLVPVSSAVLGWVLLDDQLTSVQLVGATLIVIGIAVASGAVDEVRSLRARPAWRA